MTQFTADTQQMRTKSAQVLRTAEQVRTEVNSLQASLLQLQGAWSGGASTQFQSLLTQWRAVQSKVEASLTQISTALTTASTQYDEAERTNRALFQH
ncbi:WXG100 family type VII secretion target [Galactobacter caseinivorans]|uniref:ESAT-6-like protein n=1 Tax=Galactobacter caseinivorans TaxID=2676123 RepID=A0A496PFE5_9MICC|nr:WXG100 family type VII secretion target [Galactobacter caseinivorans]RKW69439.1 WXG100 family type VII secretion target [Galactobacter caseinivorans]